MKTIRVLFKTECILAIREFSGVLFGILLPAGLILLLGVIYQGGMVEQAQYTKIQQAFGGVITIGICATGLMGIPLTITSYREKKVLKRFQVTPTSPMNLLFAQVLSQLVFAILSSVIVYLIAKLAFGYTMIGSVLEFILTYLLVTASIYALGMCIASISNSIKTVNLLCTIIYFPMIFLSGATVPYEVMPKGLQAFAQVMPLTHGIKLLKGVSLGEPIGSFTVSIIILIFTAIMGMLISIKTFKYTFD